MTRRLVREEGLFCGASSGAAVAGALKYLARHDREGMVAVVILPDGGSRYLSKVFNDKWMEEGGYTQPPHKLGTVGDLRAPRGKRELVHVAPNASIKEVIGTMKLHSISQVPVVAEGRLIGMLHEKRLLERALEGNRADIQVRDLVEMTYCTVDDITEITVLTELFKRFKVAVVLDRQSKPIDIITRIDLIDYISRVSSGAQAGGPQ